MICHVCGMENSSGGVCQRCGTYLGGPEQPPYFRPDLALSPALSRLKSLGASGRFLTVAILFSCALGFQMLSLFLLNGLSVDYLTSSLGQTVDLQSTAVGVVVGCAPTVATIIGLWIFYASCRQPGGRVSSASLTIFRVVSIVNQVIMWLLLGCMALYLVLLLVLGGAAISTGVFSQGLDYESGIAGGLLIVLFLFVAIIVAVAILQIVFTFKTLRAIRSVEYTVATGMPADDISGFMIGWCYVTGAVSLLTVFALNIAGGCIGVAYILLAGLLSKYKAQMCSLMMPYNPYTPLASAAANGCVNQPQPSYAASSALAEDTTAGRQNNVPAILGDNTPPIHEKAMPTTAHACCQGCGRPLAPQEVFCPQCGKRR